MAEELVITALEIALEQVIAFIKIGQDKNREIMERCRAYLDAIQQGVKGLENEYDEILSQAEVCNLNRSKQVSQLRKRITDYLTVDQLRTELGIARQGLEDCEKQLREIADSKLQFWWREKRDTALAMFNYLIEELAGYLKELEDRGLQYRASWSGVGIRWLKPIKELLDTLDPQQKDNKSRLNSYIADARKDRSKDNLMYYTQKIEHISNLLSKAFT